MKTILVTYECDKCGFHICDSEDELIAMNDIPFDWRGIKTYVQRSAGRETRLLLCPKCNKDFEASYIPLDERTHKK